MTQRKGPSVEYFQAEMPHSDRPSEFEVLLLLSRRKPDAECQSRVHYLTRRRLDWEFIRSAAEQNGVLPLLHRNVHKVDCRYLIPAETFAKMEIMADTNARHNLLLTAQLLEITALLEANSVPVIPYKGPTLSKIVYGDMGVRQFSDLDVFVPKKDVLRTKEILIAAGFRPQLKLNASQESHLLNCECEYNFFSPSDKFLLEIHWQVVPRRYPFHFDMEALWETSTTLVLAGRSLRTFPPRDLLLMLCGHAAKHLWSRILLMSDIAGLIEISQPLDWDALMSQASRQDLHRIVFVSLHLAERFFGLLLPDRIRNKILADPEVTYLAEQVHGNWILGIDPQAPERNLDNHRFILRLLEHKADRLRYLCELAFTPTPADWELRLPPWLTPGYRLVRVLRLLARYTHRALTTVSRPRRLAAR